MGGEGGGEGEFEVEQFPTTSHSAIMCKCSNSIIKLITVIQTSP